VISLFLPKYHWYFGVTLLTMQKRYTVQEYATKMQVDISTIYRWARQGKVLTEKILGVLHIVVDDTEMQKENTQMPNDDDIIAELRERIRYLEKENETKNEIIKQLQADAESAKQRSDTIILQLTRQFEEQTKLIEDMRPRSLWSRVKTALGFASS
jgi:predicted site-specific integrase-resolvase